VACYYFFARLCSDVVVYTAVSMPRIPRIVPWTSYQELEYVYNMLYFDGPEAEFRRDLGIQRVSTIS
jgi:hypothetical protein